ncbi:magnesium chelatase subunit H [cf. Phormidesmis sp. LEGE 11477]|uniref:magnesium chelatase subunit H n=1 Tax=cf. Phormidesmis sp. LEGE 11477 TaxID=1828680 RepID=UPI001881D8EA|nr:magnesium chelatase subunit H [cf. Phormidesmis sp. LEGE 11477]MBE9062260.1 magnesium chelatase subunit H [cf. Phormidesmis sp. LEGE 11477]
MARIVLIAGFEAFNTNLYEQAAASARRPDLEIQVFCDRDLTTQPEAVAQALAKADIFFASLIFDYDQVIWLRDRLEHIPTRLIFESALELMALTQLGKFAMRPKSGQKKAGMPKPVQFILNKFGSGKEEDRLAGYLSFLKVGPKLLKYVPARKVQDLRNWLIIYGYWNAGGSENVTALFNILAEKYLGLSGGEIPPVIETPNMGLLHPDHDGYFESPQAYIDWYREARAPELQTGASRPAVAILLYRKHVITHQPYIPQLIRCFEQANLTPVPIFINGVEGHVAVRDWMTTAYEQAQRALGNKACLSLSSRAVKVDAIVSTIGFPLVGGPAGSMEAGRQVAVAKRILAAKNVPYVVSAPLLIQDVHSWTRQGIGGLQSVVLYALPELDGAIDPVPLGGLVGDRIYLVPERVKRLTGRLNQWITLRQKPLAERKLAVILYGFPPGYGATGTAALLNVPESLLNLLRSLKEAGYEVGDLPASGEEIVAQVKAADEWMPGMDGGETIPTTVSVHQLSKWLGYLQQTKIERQWQSLTGTGIKTFKADFLLGGVQLGNVWIGVQPPLGIAGDPMRLMFERDLTPHPQYAAFYSWLKEDFRADAVVHFGMHGTAEWLPGSPLGNTGYSWSDILLGNLPNLYVYAANNPSESMLAKRRGYGVLISHNVPPYGRAGLYKELLSLRELIAEYRENPEANAVLKGAICKQIVDSGLEADCPFTAARDLGIEFSAQTLTMFSPAVFDEYMGVLYRYLQTLENRLFSSGLHVLGATPTEADLESYLSAYFGDRYTPELQAAIAQSQNNAQNDSQNNSQPAVASNVLSNSVSDSASSIDQPQLEEALLIRDRLLQTPDELTNLLRGLNGEYILPAPGGDLLRDGPGVLPTGRNIHALDPYRMPSPAAYERGRAIAQKILSQALAETGQYPETIAVMLWGLDAIKTKGESLGILLELVGATPIKESTGRIVRYDLSPLAELNHPRIDILANLSGIFRDSFVNILELLDDLFQRAAMADEPIEQNFIRKHVLALQAQGVENASARLFSNPAGDYGSLVNDRVVDSNWESADELGKTWCDRNTFSYGRQDKGQARPEILETLLKSTSRVVQQIDSVEYGLTDIQEYYANTGALKQAAEARQGQRVTASFVESFSKDTTPRKLEDLLRMEYRTKLLNPKWAEAMAEQGSGGVYEISQRMTALVGWGGTARFKDSWVYDQAAQTYAFDAEMATKLRQANPEAFRNLVGRMIEAHGRGWWTPDEDRLEKLQSLYDLADQDLEGVS